MSSGRASHTACAVRDPFSTASAVIAPARIRIRLSLMGRECSLPGPGRASRPRAERSAPAPPIGGEAGGEGLAVGDARDPLPLHREGGGAGGGRGRLPRIAVALV